MIRHLQTPRPAFTLVEMLVAMGLAVVILALGVAVSQSSAFESYKVTGSADRLSQWMLVAKSKALRDRAPRGLRLITDAANANLVREVAYIEQPEPWAPTAGVALTNSSARLIIQRIVKDTTIPANSPAPDPQHRVDSYDRFSESPPANYPPASGTPDLANSPTAAIRAVATRVFLINIPDPTGTIAAGDLLHIPELGSPARIKNIQPNPNGVANNALNPVPTAGYPWPPAPKTPLVNWTVTSVVELELATLAEHALDTDLVAKRLNLRSQFSKFDMNPSSTGHLVSPAFQTTNFAVYRAARPLLGEPTLQLPVGMAVDMGVTPNLGHPNPVTDSSGKVLHWDILFAPSGEVVSAPSSLTALLLRDVALNPGTINVTVAADYDKAGQMILICVYNRTGAIATQPVAAPPATDPYQFAKDGINTGL